MLYKSTAPFLSLNKKQDRCLLLHEISKNDKEKLEELLVFEKKQKALNFTLTFDDGFYSSCRVIKELKGKKAIFFVCPEFINAKDKKAQMDFFHNNLRRGEIFNSGVLPEDLRPVTWDNLRELVRLGHRIGSHTMTHAKLSRLVSQKDLEKEIIESGNIIEDQLGVKVDCFSHPFGNVESINKQAYNIIKQRYRECYTGIRGNNQKDFKPHAIWRDHLDLSWPVDYINFVLRGGLDWYYWSKRRKIINMAQ
ncbi:MAG: polysaccharide deacetylase family protein [bacterium]|nr:polysaccharide deacetylase family protein [bacterium]